ncbi:hypothetical protein ACHQM5_008687 [Ranunculus cassubicifolius]
MEGKTPVSVVIAVLLILGLVLEQTQVEAKSNCPTTFSRNCYNSCRFIKRPRPFCAKSCGCTLTTDLSTANDIRDDFCRFGCRAYMCQSVSLSQNSDVGEEVERGDDRERCYNECSEICSRASQEV